MDKEATKSRLHRLAREVTYQTYVHKLAYLTAVLAAKEEHGATAVAEMLDVSRHRIYQIADEAEDMRRRIRQMREEEGQS